MLQSDSSAQTASTHHLWHAASAIPAELRAGASKFNLELTASGSHLLQRSVPGLPFASLKLLRSAQPFEPGLRIHPLVTMKLQNFIRQQSFTKKIDQGLDMLVLSRKKDEKIVIGDSITLMVIEIRGDKVRLGIEAPRDVTVHREEVYEAIKRENTPDNKTGK